MRQVIKQLNEINFNRATDRHQFNDIYEQILAHLQGAGNAGEYYTPGPVTSSSWTWSTQAPGETFRTPRAATRGLWSAPIEHVAQAVR